eukprot:CAMPEP_0194495870 /NCGR_PEP_ID=MMETSP0253-20130528/13327_1 /TAXON_ID=2966 /ORGANISM="Noctiluca scintillans" /LENGTH=69 /DNA_ID=CAMNT_0039337191 /DNA_START=297 /DNA_END=509 /DNA_ORIENTATION=+
MSRLRRILAHVREALSSTRVAEQVDLLFRSSIENRVISEYRRRRAPRHLSRPPNPGNDLHLSKVLEVRA